MALFFYWEPSVEEVIRSPLFFVFGQESWGAFLFMLHAATNALRFYLPAFVGNLGVYLLFARIGKDIIPMDLHGTIAGKRILGDGRTLLGVIGFFVFSLIVGVLQHREMESLYLGMGACFGCTVNSLIKRTLGIPRGNLFFPFDQIDHVLGASLFYASRYPLDRGIFIGGLAVGFSLHVFVNLFRKTWESFIETPKG